MVNSEVINRKFAEACVKAFDPTDSIDQVLAQPPSNLRDFMAQYCSIPPGMEDVSTAIGDMRNDNLSDREKTIIVNMMTGRQVVRNFVASLIDDLDFEEVMFYINSKVKEQQHLKSEGMPSSIPSEREELLENFKRLKDALERRLRETEDE